MDFTISDIISIVSLLAGGGGMGWWFTWRYSRRKIECELQQQLLPVITPFHKVVIDGTTLYPYAIRHDYWNDVVKILCMEI